MQPIIDAIADDIWVLIPLSAISIGLISVAGGLIFAHYRS